MLDAAWLSLRIAAGERHARHRARPGRRLRARPLPRFAGRTLFASLVIAPTGDAGSRHRHLHAAAVRRQRPAVGGPRARLPAPSPSRTSPSRSLSSPSSCRRGSPTSTARSRRRRWISAPRPGTTFLTVTLPLIAPALVSGWLLAFTLSLDDLILTQFVSGAAVADPADARLFQRAPRRRSADQRAGDHRDRHRRERARSVNIVDSRSRTYPRAPGRALTSGPAVTR